MSSNVWQSEPYLESYKWLLDSMPPLLARTKAFSSDTITQSERQSLAAIGDNQEHNETLLAYLERSQENYPCLVDIVTEMGCDELAKRLRQALPPTSSQSPQHLACASAAEPHPQPAYPVQHTLAHQSQPGLLQGPPPQLKPRSQSRPLPLPAPGRLPIPDEPLETEAKRQPPYVYPLDALAHGGAAAEANNLQAAARHLPLVFEASPSSSDTGIDSDMEEDIIRTIKVFIWRERCDDFDVNHIRHTLKKNYRLDIQREYMTVDADEEARQQGDAISTVKVVIGCHGRATAPQKKDAVARVRESLRWCGIPGLSVRCIEDGSIVIYALIPISDLIRLYQVAAHYPGVLAGIGILEISTLGRTTVISFRTSPAGPVEEPIHPSLAAFIDDMVPGQSHVGKSSEPNMHHAVRSLVSNLPVDGEALPKVIKWLENHRNDVFNTPSLFGMDPEGYQPSSGVSSISTARSPGDAKISKTSQRTPAGASKEGSISPTNAGEPQSQQTNEDETSAGSSSHSPPAKRRNARQVSGSEDDITTTADVSRRVERDSQNLKVIASIVNSVLALGEAEPFAQHVSLKDIRDREELTAGPMDFGTIRTRLKDMHYDDVETVLKDVHLVFHNCDACSKSSTVTYKSGLELERYFLKLLKTQLKDFFPRYTIALV